MKILVTGAAGFIGSNVATHLHLMGHDVLSLDDEHLGKFSNLPEYLRNRYFHRSITDKRGIDLLGRYGIECIINFASYSSAPMFNENPTAGFHVNVDGFRNILEFAQRYDIKVIYASTSSLYSSADSFKEEAVVRPQTYYEYTKYCNEVEARIFEDRYGLETLGLRFFSVYGFNEEHKKQYANLVSQFLWEMKKGNTPVIYGDGTQTRDFTWAGDVANAIMMLVEKNKWQNRILNIGTGTSHSLIDLVNILNDELGTHFDPMYIKNPIKNYVKDTCADLTQLKKEIFYYPKTSLREGIKNLIK
jgi:UDP-glucose 4-epimerase